MLFLLEVEILIKNTKPYYFQTITTSNRSNMQVLTSNRDIYQQLTTSNRKIHNPVALGLESPSTLANTSAPKHTSLQNHKK